MRHSALHVCRIPVILLALLGAAATCSGFDVWGDNGSTPIGGGNNSGPGGPGPGPDPGPHDGEPVAIYSGQYTLTAVDVDIPGRMPLRVKRFYRSGSNYQGMFGRGWNLEFNERLFVLSTNGNLLLRRNDVTKDEFTNLGNNVFAPLAGSNEVVAHNPDGTYTIRDKGGGVRQYNPQGCLTLVQDRNGNQLVLSYQPGGKLPINAISDFSHFTNAILVARDFQIGRIEVAWNGALSGRYLQFFYDDNGRTTNATDFTGRAWTYQYDARGNLLSVTTPTGAGFPSGTVTRYTYTVTNHWLEAVTDKSGNTLLTNRYDSTGRIVQQIWGNAVFSFAYPSATDRWLTNGNGYRVERLFDANGQMTERRDYTSGLRPGAPAYYSTKYVYTTNAQQQATVIYPAGNVDVTKYDALGNLIESRRKAADTNDGPQDLVTTLTYEPRYNQVKTVTRPRGGTVTNVFDYEDPSSGRTNGNIIRVIYPPINGVTPVISSTFTSQGEADMLTNALGGVTKNIYEPATGYLLQTINAFGTLAATTNTYTYDARGNVLTMTDPLGNTTTHVYDNLDHRIQTTTAAPLSYVTKYSYTGNGDVAQSQKQTGDATHPWQTNSFTYDLLSRLTTASDDSGHVTRLAYDANGNLIQTIDASTNVTTRVYDERNLLWKVTDAGSNTIVQSYSLNGFLATWTDPRSNTTRVAYDVFGRLIAITNVDGTFELLVPDAEGNVMAKRKLNGLWTTNFFDVMGQLLARTNSDGTWVRFQIDLAGEPISITDSNGTLAFGYDVFGRTVASTNTFGQTLGYAYDRVGNLRRLTYPDGSYVSYLYDSFNRPTNITYQGVKTVANLAYDGLGRRTRIDYGDGTFATYAYDVSSRLADLNHLSVGGGSSLAHFVYAFDPVGNRLTQNTTGTRFPGLSSFQYDKTYQLTQVQYPPGSPFPATTLQYDGSGNRVQVNAGSAALYVANARNQYTSVGAQTLIYTPGGGLAGDGTWSYGYDTYDRLTSAQGPGVNAIYSYDAFGRRVAKNVNGTVRRFIYNDTGDAPMLLGESDGSGNLQSKYVLCGLSPLALILSNTVFSLHCDHLERPVLATDEGGAVAWEAAYSAFGEVNLPTTNRITQPLRSPGLYGDPESDLQYNMARFYDAKRGRFVSEDPGLEAGSPLFSQVQEKNAYAYLRNNPVNNIDPNGQSLIIVCSAGLPVCSGAIFCSLNVGICSAGLVCSANAGACSFGLACSGSAVGACSAALACSGTAAGGCSVGAICSGGGATACSAQVGTSWGGACSAATFCSGQVGVGGVSACSASLYACSAQAGVGGASLCSANVAGACSGQVGIGNSACSAQVAGVCSGQVGPGAFACSGNVTIGGCSAQVGIGPAPSYCSAQGAGLCSAQLGVAGSGNSYCSVQGAGACSAQGGWGSGANACSAQGAGACSANEGGSCSTQGAGNCSGAQCKHARLDERGRTERLLAFGSRERPAALSSLHVGTDERSAHLEIQLGGLGYNHFEVLARHAQRTDWQPLCSGPMADGTLSQWRVDGLEPGKTLSLKLRTRELCGRVQEWGPFPVCSSEPAAVAKPSLASRAVVRSLLTLAFLSVLLISGRLD